MSGSPAAFISYSREDSEFVLRLAQDLKNAGAPVWLDQMDIKPGHSWDNAIEDALMQAHMMLLVLSPASSKSENVRNEISFALQEGKIVIPVLYQDCVVPLRLQRTQRIDFRADYARGLTALLGYLGVTQPDAGVLQNAADGDAQRHAAWQAREAEAQRLRELEQRRVQEEPRQPVAVTPLQTPEPPQPPPESQVRWQQPAPPASPQSIVSPGFFSGGSGRWVAGGIGALALVAAIIIFSRSGTRPTPVPPPAQTAPSMPQQGQGGVTPLPPPAALPPQQNTWTDPATGLTWTRKDSGYDVTWRQAMDYCANLRLAGHTGWQLPTVDQLQGIYDANLSVPGRWGPDRSIIFHVKGRLDLTGRQWSSSPGRAPGEAWSFPFNNGVRFSAQVGLSEIRRALCVRRAGE